MQSEEITVEAPQLQLPPELLAEVNRRNAGGKTDYRVDAWKPSLLERLAKMLGLA